MPEDTLHSILAKHPVVGYLHAGANELQRILREGDGASWPGDPRLSLACRVIEHPTRRGVHGRRYEVWRNMEDGGFELINHWRLDEFQQILPDMIKARMDSPAWTPAEERMDANNARIEKEHADRYVDRMAPMMEHLRSLRKHHSPHEAQDTFYMSDIKPAAD